MGLAYSEECIACSALPRIAALRAAIASSHFGFTTASFPRSNRLNQGRSLIPSRTSLVFPSGTERKPKVDFRRAKRIIAKGDGVRLTTAVLLAGQMMTPDKILVAESCPRQRSNQENGELLGVWRPQPERYARFFYPWRRFRFE
jgi:hypothetical protein